MRKPLTSSIIFSILIITACSAWQSSEVTVTRFAKVTVTLPSPTETLTPLPTPLPTPSPQAQLPKKYTQDEINQMTPAEILAQAPELEGYEKWRAAGKYAMYLNAEGQVEKAYDMTIGEYRDIPDYPVTTPENFRQNKISVDELLNGDYFLSLQKLAKQLECSPTMRTDVPLIKFMGRILYDQSNTPNFDVPRSEPFIRDYTSAFVEFPLADGQVVDYAVMPLFMCDLNDNTKVYPIMTVYSSYNPNENRSQQEDNNLYMGDGVPRWRKDMAITVITTSEQMAYPGRSGIIDPLVAQVFTKYGEEEMKNRFDRYIRIEKLINSFTPTILGEQEPKHDYRANHTSM